MRILMLFLDGVGIGENDPSVNPFFVAQLPTFRSLFHGDIPSLRKRVLQSDKATLVPLDATLGVGGLPQSGTGQTSLFTGVNGAKVIGKHFGPHPYSSLRPIIEQKNIFRQMIEAGKRPCFANAFPRQFFEYMERKRTRLSVTTLSCTFTGLPLRRAEELSLGQAVSADITNAGWPELGYPNILRIEPEEAGRRLVALTETHDFVLFEYWKTDHAGHSKSMSEAVEVLGRLDAMLRGIIETLDTATTLLVITSDHGNIEDLSTKSHTRNIVPLFLYGCRHKQVGQSFGGKRLSTRGSSRLAGSLVQVTPAIMEYVIGD